MKFTFSSIYPEATNEQKWEQIRFWRNAQLAATDWTQVADAPVNKTLWAAYRQELRDLPANWTNADDVELPEQPA